MTAETTAPAFEIVTSPAAIEPASVFGLHYNDNVRRVDVARELRAAFKRAQQFGAFKGVKVSITSERGAVTVKILVAPFARHDPRKLDRNIRSSMADIRVSTSDRMRLLVAQIEMLGGMWRRDDSDISSDYFNTNAFLFVTVATDDAEEWRAARARVAADSLRYAVACVDRLAPLADDRPVEAVECLARYDLADAEALARAAVIASPASVEADLGRAVVAVCEAVGRNTLRFDNAFIAAGSHVRRAVELAGRTAEEAQGVYAAALAA